MSVKQKKNKKIIKDVIRPVTIMKRSTVTVLIGGDTVVFILPNVFNKIYEILVDKRCGATDYRKKKKKKQGKKNGT